MKDGEEVLKQEANDEAMLHSLGYKQARCGMGRCPPAASSSPPPAPHLLLSRHPCRSSSARCLALKTLPSHLRSSRSSRASPDCTAMV